MLIEKITNRLLGDKEYRRKISKLEHITTKDDLLLFFRDDFCTITQVSYGRDTSLEELYLKYNGSIPINSQKYTYKFRYNKYISAYVYGKDVVQFIYS